MYKMKITNKYVYKEDRIEIITEGGKYDNTILIDKDDEELAREYVWRIDNNGYVQACDLPRTERVYLHRHLMNPGDKDILVDHQDRDRLNNRRSNLKLTNHSGNNSNQSKRKDNKTGVTGVKTCGEGRYEAQITHNGKRETKKFSGVNAFERACEWREQKAREYGNKNGK